MYAMDRTRTQFIGIAFYYLKKIYYFSIEYHVLFVGTKANVVLGIHRTK